MDENQATTAALSSPPSARELVACWGHNVQTFALSKTVVIGRSEACDVLVSDASVSRTHARLEVSERGMELEDLGSANGTQVDGAPVKGRARVLVGSILLLGKVRFVVRLTIGPALGSPMLELRRVVDKVATSSASLILIGETGVGKEVLAEEIHARSGRPGPLVRLNCAGLTATLLESELFGHERGAFTGAVEAKPGLIESADRGTLFLDELAEMPESTQPKLLRVLESREVRRLGSVRSKAIDVRFVSATHRDPRTLAVMGKFREDLLFRLNGLTLMVPPLRERRDEILVLAERFLQAACKSAGRATPGLSPGARVLIESYRWPGNVRELKNLMDRVALLSEGPVVLVEHLAFDPAHTGAVADDAQGLAPVAGSERERIIEKLAAAGGNLAAAAKALGVTPRVLAYRMDKLGLPRPRRR